MEVGSFDDLDPLVAGRRNGRGHLRALISNLTIGRISYGTKYFNTSAVRPPLRACPVSS
jgi:hypothetical protein